MRPRIAIPLPLSNNPEYVGRSLPQYEHAVRFAGGVPIRVPLDITEDEVKRLAEQCDGVLLPGGAADIDPAKYRMARHPKTELADPHREAVDQLLIEEAYEQRKPILGICYGMQILNVFRSGSLLQHIESKINHEAGRKVKVAHQIEVDGDSRLGSMLGPVIEQSAGEKKISIPVNSSHHQSADVVGGGLRVVATCPDDGIVEAIEGTSPEHFVLGVQWHPERSLENDASSPAIFRALIENARAQQARSR